MRKGENTRQAILESSLNLSAKLGLDGLTIGLLAESIGMSKSGVFAHFGSREELQIATLKAYEQRFTDAVLKPAVAMPRGLPRVYLMASRWVELLVKEAELGCVFISAAAEFDDQEGPVRDQLVASVRHWQHSLIRAMQQAVNEGHWRADADLEQIVFELYGIALSLHHDARLLRQTQSVTRARRALRRLLHEPLTEAGLKVFSKLVVSNSEILLSDTPQSWVNEEIRHAPVHRTHS